MGDHSRVAVFANDVGQARTVAGEPVAVGVLFVGSEDVALALAAGLRHGVAKVPGLAVLAVVALRVEDALEALASAGVAIACVLFVPIVAAVALDA